MAENLKQKMFKGTVWTSIETFAVQGFNFIQGIILARILSQADFGLVAEASVFLSISAVFVDSGFSNALVRNKERSEVDYSTTFLTNVVLSFFFCILLCLFSPLISKFYHEPVLKDIIIVCAIQLFLGSFVAVQSTRLTIMLDFKTKSIVRIFSVVITGLVAIAMAFMGYGVWSLILPNFLGFFVQIILYWHFQHWLPGLKFSMKSWKNSFAFGSKLLASSLLDTVYGQIYPLLIGKKYSTVDLGYYSKASGYASLPSTTATGVLSKVAFPVLSQIQDDDKALESVYRRMIKVSTFIVFPMMMGIAALAKPLVIALITEKWAQSIIYLQILCFALMWYPVHSLNLNLLQVKGRSDLFLRLEVIKKTIGVSILFITVPFGLKALCAGQIVSSIICLVINTHYTGKLINVGFFKQMKDLMPSFLNAVSMGVIVWFAVRSIPDVWLQLLVGILLGMAYYLGISFLTKSEELNYVVALVNENILRRGK